LLSAGGFLHSDEVFVADHPCGDADVVNLPCARSHLVTVGIVWDAVEKNDGIQ
jgi:hypothetical protein